MRALTERSNGVFEYKSTWTKVQRALRQVFQQERTYGSFWFKGIVSDHGSTALGVTYIGYGVKTPTNLGLTFSLSDESFAIQEGGQCAAVLESGV